MDFQKVKVRILLALTFLRYATDEGIQAYTLTIKTKKGIFANYTSLMII